MQTNAIILHVWSPNNVSSPLNEDYLSLSLSDASKSDRTSASQVVILIVKYLLRCYGIPHWPDRDAEIETYACRLIIYVAVSSIVYIPCQLAVSPTMKWYLITSTFQENCGSHDLKYDYHR